MRGISRIRVVLWLFVFATVSSVVSAQESAPERTRGIYIDLGLGFGDIRYLNGDAKTIAKGFSQGAATRSAIDLDMFTIGGAIRDDLYVVGSITAFGEVYSYTKTSESQIAIDAMNQITIPMYGVGVRWYPLQSKKHLQLGYDLGISILDVRTEEFEDTSNTGFSQRVSVGWDFDSTLTGLAAILGGCAMFNIIEGDTSVSYALFVRLVFKGRLMSPR
ncbi:MAG: hypothetical protein LBK61_08960 [Spirochaetaceae bacterium]|jgi:hypothetical protein|nr:hypothetical protein [Spirochaetaceae bacterium]